MDELKAIKSRPNEQTVVHIQWLLDHAKAGRLRSIAAVCQWDDASVSHGYCLARDAKDMSILGTLRVLENEIAFRHTGAAEELGVER